MYLWTPGWGLRPTSDLPLLYSMLRFCRSPGVLEINGGVSTAWGLGLSPKISLLYRCFPSFSAAKRSTEQQCSYRSSPCDHGHGVHSSRQHLRTVVLTTGRRDSRPCVYCGEARPYEQLRTKSAAAGSHKLQGQFSSSAGVW